MIIDCHMHVNWQGHNVDDAVRHMNEIGVDKAWLLTWEEMDGGLNPGYVHLSAGSVMSAAKMFPKRFIPFCAVDPRRENAERTLRELVKRGCRGYGEHKLRLMVDNYDSIRMYKLCGELGLPVLIHLDVPLGSTFWYGGSVDAFERALVQCPKTNFVGHGPGFWREISGSADRSRKMYPGGKIKPGGKLRKLMAKYPNLYADLSAHSGLNAMKRDVPHAKRFLKKFYRKILYGTDYFDRKHLDFLEKLNLEKRVFNAVAGGNAAKLVKRR